MSLKALCRGLLAVAALAALAGGAFAQTMFYNEVAKDGRIYVFASGQRFDTFQKSGGAEIGVAITRPGYGPNGETVVFDSEDAINLYNYKHGLPGEYFPKPKEAPKPVDNFKIGVGTTIFADYTYQDAPKITDADKNSVNASSFEVRRAYINVTGNISDVVAFRVTPDVAARQTTTVSGLPAGGSVARQPRREPRHPPQVRASGSSTSTRSPPTAPGSASASSRRPTWTSWRASTATASRGRSSSSAKAS